MRVISSGSAATVSLKPSSPPRGERSGGCGERQRWRTKLAFDDLEQDLVDVDSGALSMVKL